MQIKKKIPAGVYPARSLPPHIDAGRRGRNEINKRGNDKKMERGTPKIGAPENRIVYAVYMHSS